MLWEHKRFACYKEVDTLCTLFCFVSFCKKVYLTFFLYKRLKLSIVNSFLCELFLDNDYNNLEGSNNGR